MNPITFANGQASWSSRPGDSFLITGKDRNGKRFRIESISWRYTVGINLWRGTKWLIRDGKRFKISTVYN